MQDEALRAAGLQEEEARRPGGPGWRVWAEKPGSWALGVAEEWTAYIPV